MRYTKSSFFILTVTILLIPDIDSSGKTPAAFLEGTVTSLGDYDQCLAITDEALDGSKNIGQYCVLKLKIRKETLASSRVGERIDQIVPPCDYFEPLFALCLPSSCNQEDVKKIVSSAVASKGIKVLELTHCDTRDSIAFSFAKLSVYQCLSLVFVLVFLVLVSISTWQDIKSGGSFLREFSLKANTIQLMTIQDGGNRLNFADHLKFGFSLCSIIMHSTIAETSPDSTYFLSKS